MAAAEGAAETNGREWRGLRGYRARGSRGVVFYRGCQGGGGGVDSEEGGAWDARGAGAGEARYTTIDYSSIVGIQCTSSDSHDAH